MVRVRHLYHGDVERSRGAFGIVDSHVHFWDPNRLRYPWLADTPPLNRAFGPTDYEQATAGIGIERMVFVECNPDPACALEEVQFIEALAREEPRIGAMVAFADLLDPRLPEQLERLAAHPSVRGVRHNIQWNPPGFALQRAFVEGVQAVGAAGLHFEIGPTHDQLGDVVELVQRCPDVRLVLDHCGKPGIRAGEIDAWAAHIRTLADHEALHCKLSGLVTEAEPFAWTGDTLEPYAACVLDAFGPGRVLYGGDWPVVTQASTYRDWYGCSLHLTRHLDEIQHKRVYRDNALAFYRMPDGAEK